MKRSNICAIFALVLVVAMVYPLLFQSLHILHDHALHHGHDHSHSEHAGDGFTLQEEDQESTTYCYICDYHLSHWFIQETSSTEMVDIMSCPIKTVLVDHHIRSFNGFDLSLRAPPAFL